MLLLIWRGYGILTPFIALVLWLVPLAVAESILGHATYVQLSAPLSLLFGGATAAALWLVGSKLNGVPGRLLIDPKTGQQVVLRKRHEFFFIPMQWWAIPVALLVLQRRFKCHIAMLLVHAAAARGACDARAWRGRCAPESR